MDHSAHTEVLLIGGGHTHALFLRQWGMRPLPGVRLTLISRSEYAPYSGMLPGLVAGHFNWRETHIDLVRLCRFAGARFIAAEAIGLDPKKRLVYLRDQTPLYGDILSINTGITPDVSVPGAEAFTAAVKPINNFYQRWVQLRDSLSQRRSGEAALSVGVIGGGVAGVELVQAMHYALGQQNPDVRFHLVHAGAAVPEACPPRVQQRIAALLNQKGIALHCNFRVGRVFDGGVESDGGAKLALDAVFWCTSALAPAWPAESGLACAGDGCIRVDACLQSISHPHIFACGDIAHLDHETRPKAGVYAVRQAPILYRNIVNSAQSRPLRTYQPQKHALRLIACGNQYAVASRWRLAVSGRWVWRWKELVDRRFMQQFQFLP